MMATCDAPGLASRLVATAETAAGPDLGDRRAVHQRQRLARARREQQDRSLVRVLPGGRVARRDADRLQPVPGRRRVGRHQAHETRRVPRPDDRPQRLLDLAAGQLGQGLAHHVGAFAVAEQLGHVGGGQDDDLHAALEPGPA
jgi:hypothetical protein